VITKLKFSHKLQLGFRRWDAECGLSLQIRGLKGDPAKAAIH
jgi:hypothetical protein